VSRTATKKKKYHEARGKEGFIARVFKEEKGIQKFRKGNSDSPQDAFSNKKGKGGKAASSQKRKRAEGLLSHKENRFNPARWEKEEMVTPLCRIEERRRRSGEGRFLLPDVKERWLRLFKKRGRKKTREGSLLP